MSPVSPTNIPSRYGIGQWFGLDPRQLPDKEVVALGANAMAGETRTCPFYTSLGRTRACNKAGGVCTLRRISQDGTLPDDQMVTTCPSRFLEDGAIFRETGAYMLGATHVRVVNELPFLKNASDASGESASGRIDWIAQDSNDEENWCAIEFQSLYFSGAALDADFADYATGAAYPAYPSGRRPPDCRSNGPKRLGPQLSIKVPLLRSWERQVAVVVDRYFFSCMDAAFTQAVIGRNDPLTAHHDIGLFVVDYDPTGKLGVVEKIPVSLDVFLRALDSSKEMEREEFETDWWIHGRSTETDFLHVTTQTLSHAQLAELAERVGEGRTLLVLCGGWRGDATAFGTLTVRKIPDHVLRRCDWGRDSYTLPEPIEAAE